MELYDEVEQWAEKADPKDIIKWEYFANKYMKEWKWNQKAREDFIKWGKYGFNNTLLRELTNIASFYSEVEYSSDRMSIDRLFRCNVKYHNIQTQNIKVTQPIVEIEDLLRLKEINKLNAVIHTRYNLSDFNIIDLQVTINRINHDIRYIKDTIIENKKEIRMEFEILFKDLTEEAQKRLCKEFNTTPEEEYWDSVPLTIISRDE